MDELSRMNHSFSFRPLFLSISASITITLVKEVILENGYINFIYILVKNCS